MLVVKTYQQQALFIEALLGKYSQKKEKNEIKDYYSKIHNNFFSLKKEFPEYFARLIFNENGHIPYSEDLDAIIQDFQMSGLINKYNPSFNTMNINIKDTESVICELKHKLPDFNPEKIDEIVAKMNL